MINLFMKKKILKRIEKWYIVNEEELHSLSKLFDKMRELAKPSTNVHATKKCLKEKLQLK